MQEGGKRLNSTAKQARVSIITVVFNAERFLPGFLSGVAPFLTDDVELIMADGNSTDGTVNLLHQHSHIIDYWRSETDKGIYDAMNKAVQWASGRWVFFLGADDHLEAGFADMLRELTDPQTIYYGNTIYYGKLYTRVYDDYYLTKMNLVHQSLFYPRPVFDNYRYDLKYPVYADYQLNLRLWGDKSFKFEYRNHLVAGFPAGGFSSHNKDPQFETDKDALYRKYLSRKAYYRYLNRTLGFFKALLKIISHG